jgi:RNA polymerase sporulation-specific sigma factor
MDVLSSDEDSIIEVVENKIQVKKLFKELNNTNK